MVSSDTGDTVAQEGQCLLRPTRPRQGRGHENVHPGAPLPVRSHRRVHACTSMGMVFPGTEGSSSHMTHAHLLLPQSSGSATGPLWAPPLRLCSHLSILWVRFHCHEQPWLQGLRANGAPAP